jgi:hypothetical protein
VGFKTRLHFLCHSGVGYCKSGSLVVTLSSYIVGESCFASHCHKCHKLLGIIFPCVFCGWFVGDCSLPMVSALCCISEMKADGLVRKLSHKLCISAVFLVTDFNTVEKVCIQKRLKILNWVRHIVFMNHSEWSSLSRNSLLWNLKVYCYKKNPLLDVFFWTNSYVNTVFPF